MTQAVTTSDGGTGAGAGRARASWLFGWGGAIAFALLLGAARLGYLVWLCPYDLIEDEAHYWEWSRRIALAYYTKGPGVAWVIWASTTALGASEWTVRLPAVIASVVGSLAVGALAVEAARDRRAALWGAAAHQCAPAVLATSLLMTIDGPYMACWAVSAWLGFRAVERRSGWALVACGAAIGVGFLFKYTILLLPLGMLAWRLTSGRASGGGGERAGRWGWRAMAFAAFLIAISPVIVWNSQRGWPTLAHLLEHLGLGAGGAAEATEPRTRPAWDPMWTITLIVAQAGLVGFVGASIIVAVVRAVRRTWPGVEPHERRAAGYLVWCAAPVLVFYVAVSFFAEPEANWPAAGWVTLLALVGAAGPKEWDRYSSMVRAWRATPDRPKRGVLRRKPETAFQASWHWAVGCGLVVGLGMLRVDLLARVPVVGRLVPMDRVTGARQKAERVETTLIDLRNRTGLDPFVVALSYGDASQLAFYLPGRPVTRCARSMGGGQPSQYDYFEDTRLDDPSLAGRPAALVGGWVEFWWPVFERVEPAGVYERERRGGERQMFAGYGYDPSRVASSGARGGRGGVEEAAPPESP